MDGFYMTLAYFLSGLIVHRFPLSQGGHPRLHCVSDPREYCLRAFAPVFSSAWEALPLDSSYGSFPSPPSRRCIDVTTPALPDYPAKTCKGSDLLVFPVLPLPALLSHNTCRLPMHSFLCFAYCLSLPIGRDRHLFCSLMFYQHLEQ